MLMRLNGKAAVTFLLASVVLASAQEKPQPATNKYYAEQLQALKEPPIGNLLKEGVTQRYRLLWLRTFHHPVVVRVDILSDGTGWVRVKETSGQGGYKPGKLVKDDAHKLRAQEAQWFLGRMDEGEFWDLPPEEKRNESEIILDGATWIIEGSSGQRYHVVERYAPECGDKLRNIGLIMLLDMAKLKLLYTEVY